MTLFEFFLVLSIFEFLSFVATGDIEDDKQLSRIPAPDEESYSFESLCIEIKHNNFLEPLTPTKETRESKFMFLRSAK